jgi:hypothetical protein
MSDDRPIHPVVDVTVGCLTTHGVVTLQVGFLSDPVNPQELRSPTLGLSRGQAEYLIEQLQKALMLTRYAAAPGLVEDGS